MMKASESELSAQPVELIGRHFRLVPVIPPHHRAIYQLSIAEQVSFRWRFHGLIPTFEAFERNLHANVLVQFVVAPRSDLSAVAGLVVAYNANLQDGYVYVAAINDRSFGVGALEGLLLLIDYLFANWPLRKIYLEAPEFNVPQFESAIRRGLLKEESRLLEHRFYQGRFWDFITWAIYRD